MSGVPDGVRPRILIVEDDPSIVLGLRVNMNAEGYEVEVAEDGRGGLSACRRDFDLVVLDLMLPHVNGFEVLRTMRAEGITTPVIVLTARGSELDKVTGLDLGADDYVTKPFALAELLARVRAALRRPTVGSAPCWRFGAVSVDPASRVVLNGAEPVELTATEFEVLAILCRSAGRVLTRGQIHATVWGPSRAGTLRTVDNFVAQLRAKLEEDPSEPRHLVTVRGVGYRFVP